MKWTRLNNILSDKEYTCIAKVFHLRNNEIIMAVGTHGIDSTEVSSIIEYNEIDDTTIELMKFAKIRCEPNLITMDHDDRIMFFPSKYCINKLDLNIHKVYLNTMQTDKIKIENADKLGLSHHEISSTYIINNKLHIFGVCVRIISMDDGEDYSNKHIIFDIKTNKIESIHAIQKMGSHDIIIYNESKIKFIFIGLFSASFDINAHKWEMFDGFRFYNYDCYSAAILTRDEKYIIIFYNWIEVDSDSSDSDSGCDPIYHSRIDIFDIQNKKMIMSDVKLPWNYSGELHVFKVDDFGKSSVVINGYLRQCWKEKDLQEFPIEIIAIVITFYSQEYVHIIKQYGGEHWKIPLYDILSNCATTVYE